MILWHEVGGGGGYMSNLENNGEVKLVPVFKLILHI